MARKRNSSSAGGGRFADFIFNGIWLILVAAFVIAFVNVNNIDNVSTGIQYAKIKSLELQACVNESVVTETIQCNLSLKVGDNKVGNNDNNVDKGNSDNTEQDDWKKQLGLDRIGKDKESSVDHLPAIQERYKVHLDKLENLQVVDNYDENIEYDRTEWKHWLPVNKNHKCWNIREEALYRQAKSVILLDKDKNVTNDYNLACSIQSGVWIDPYTDEEFTKPSELDVDHHIPLMAAAKANGNTWSKEEKRKYANDLDLLVVMSAKQNREKGAKTPSEWMPKDKESHCAYAKLWVYNANKYQLVITNADKEVLTKSLKLCNH